MIHKLKRNVFFPRKNFLGLFFLLFAVLFPQICHSAPAAEKESVLLRENFKKLIPATFSRNDITRLRSKNFPVEILKRIVYPRDWFVSSWGIPHDLKTFAAEGGWRIKTNQKVTVYSSSINAEYSDFSLDVTLCGGNTASSVSLDIIQYDLLHQNEVLPLRRVSLPAGKTKTIHLPIHFDFVNPGFRLEFKITGDVTFRNLSIACTPKSLAAKGYSCVEGIIEACSAIPDPKKSDYPDCRFTCHLKAKSISAGVPCPRDVQLIIDGFRKYRLLGTKNLKAGDQVRCIILPFEKLPDKLKSTQQADDLELFQLENYYAAKIEKIRHFSATDIIPFKGAAEKYISVFERKINSPVSPELDQAQQSAIAADLKNINALLAGWDQKKITETNAAFQKAWKAEKAKDKPGYNRVKVKGNTYVWRNINHSFWALPEYYNLIPEQYSIIASQNMAALVAFRDFLHANGCQFIISFVPDLYEISARIITPEFRSVPDCATAWAVQDLLKNGIETIYPSPEIIKNYNRYPFAFFFPDNAHPSDTCQDILSSLIAERLKRFQFASNLEPRLFSIVQHEHVHGNEQKYFFPSSCDIGGNQPQTPYQCRCVLYDKKEIIPDSSSPILVIGNSYMQTPMAYPDSLPTLLSAKLHRSIAMYRSEGVGPFLTIIQDMFNNPEKFLKNRKIIVMQVGSYHLISTSKFCNVREMEQAALLLSGKQFHLSIPMKGNTQKRFSFAKKLHQAKIFVIPASGRELIQNFEIPDQDIAAKENVLMIPVCAPLRGSTIAVNGKNFIIPESPNKPYWNKIIVRIPPGEKKIKVELIGKTGAVIAIGDIQIYQ